MTTTSVHNDIVSLLVEDHDEVKQLFAQIDVAPISERGALFRQLTHELVVHEIGEEEIVYPRLRQIAAAEEAVADARIAEEKEAEQLLAQLEDMDPASAEFMTKYTTLKHAVLQHATEEEKVVFPTLRANLSEQELLDLGALLKKAKAAAPTHPHPTAPHTPPGNVLAGSMAAVMDKVRDALHHDSSTAT